VNESSKQTCTQNLLSESPRREINSTLQVSQRENSADSNRNQLPQKSLKKNGMAHIVPMRVTN
jgi:hypothetical protein